MGALSGWDVAILTFFLAAFFGGIFLVTSKRKQDQLVMPYIPALTLGYLTAIAYGPAVLKFLRF